MIDWSKYKKNYQEFKDLGFGSRVGNESNYRLLNRDGSFNVKRKGLSFWESMTLYQFMLRISWPNFYLLTLGSYLFINVLFATGYLIVGPDAIAGVSITGVDSSFLNVFFFSIQAFTTVGFGQLTPHGLSANILFTVESFIGLLGFALVTGFMFARFSRPHAKIAFSRHALLAPYLEGTALMFRIANKRKGELVNVSAKVIFTIVEDGQRHFHELLLERDEITFFPLNWTIVHPIKEVSPLQNLTEEDINQKDVEILVMLSGYAETFSQRVYTRASYRGDEIKCNAQFTDMYERLDDGRMSVNMALLSKYQTL